VLLSIIAYVGLVLGPYAVEQFAYWKFVTKNRERGHHPPLKTVTRYGWVYLWDLAHFAVLVAAGFRFIGQDAPLSVWEWLGWAIFGAGVALRVLALRALGPFYAGGTVIYEGHQVVDTGPYRYIRHPLHLGTTAEVAGLAMLSPLWLGLPAVAVSLVLTLYKGRDEDRALLDNLGATYARYYAQTWDVVDLIFWQRRRQVQAEWDAQKGRLP
jgi:protein-S-isoprenylcysteine O-methyltransferase Ste14